MFESLIAANVVYTDTRLYKTRGISNGTPKTLHFEGGKVLPRKSGKGNEFQIWEFLLYVSLSVA